MKENIIKDKKNSCKIIIITNEVNNILLLKKENTILIRER